MEQLAVWIGIAVVLAALLLLAAQRLLRRSGLPPGQIVYDDATGRAGRVLTSWRYGLHGKPDYLLDDDNADGLVPVEVKSGAAPPSGQPYASHLMQLAVYFLLVEDVLERPVPYGLLRYRDRTIRVANTAKLRAELLAILEQMRAAQADAEIGRSHNQVRRCRHCSVAYACSQRLA